MAEFNPYAGIDKAALTGGEGGDFLHTLLMGLGMGGLNFVKGPGDVMAGKRDAMQVGPEMALGMLGVGAPNAMAGAAGAAGGKLFNFNPHIQQLEQTIAEMKGSGQPPMPAPVPTKGPVSQNTEDVMKVIENILNGLEKPADALAPSPPFVAQEFPLSLGWSVKEKQMPDGSIAHAVLNSEGKQVNLFNTLSQADSWFSQNMKSLMPEHFPPTGPNAKKAPFDQGISLDKWLEKNPGGSIGEYYGQNPLSVPSMKTAPTEMPVYNHNYPQVPPGVPGPKLDPKIVDLEDAARLARAENAGYTTDAYHGSTSLGTNAALSARSYGDALPLLGDEFYSTVNPQLAEQYASHLHDDPNKGYYSSPGAGIVPLKLDTSNYHVVDANGRMWTDVNRRAINEARQLGKPGVRVNNVWDEYASTKTLGKPNDIFITLPEGYNTVRSPIAQFKDLGVNDLLAGLAGAGVVLPQLLPEKDGK